MGHLPSYSNKFIYKNQFIIKIDTHIKFIENNQRKKIYARLHILKILLKNKCFLF